MLALAQRLATAAMAAVLLVVLLPSHGHSAAAALPVPPGPKLGVQFHGMWSSYDDTQRALFLDQLATSGATWVRIDVSWSMLQPHGPDSYDMRWGVPFVDRVITMATDRGLTPLVTLWMTPQWANGGAGARALPHDPQDYARAAQWAADRWSEQVPAWEVWNEPNLEHFMVGADPVAYTRLLQAAAPAIHAGNPAAKVVFGGPSSNDTDWLEKAYAAGAHGYFDIMSTHPYQGVANLPPEAPSENSRYRFTHLAGVHELMKRHGDGDKPIWATEFGWSSHPNVGGERNWELGVTEQQQGDYLVRALQLVEAQMPYVTHLFWYTDRDFESESPQNGNYGLFYNDLRPKPAFHRVKEYLTSRLASTPKPAPVAPPPAPVFPDATVQLTGPAEAEADSATTYTASVTNLRTASGQAPSITVEIQVPPGDTLAGVASPETSDWSCVADATTFLCTGAAQLRPGASAPLISFDVVHASGSREVRATVTTPGDLDVENNGTRHTTEV